MAGKVDVRDLDQAIADGFVRQLGAGSYGSVWYWRSARDQREMAVKKVNKAEARRKQVASGGTLDPIEQARTESLVMKSLNHPNIVSLYDFVESPEALYLMLEYCPGGDLLALLNRVGRLDEPTAAVYFRQLIDAITYIHRSGFVHRDIKCENIFFGVAYNQILLGDFGFSGRWTPGKTLPQSWGSLHYASPEIAQGLPYEGPEVDMWSCGVVLYAMTMAALPFNGPTEADIVDQISLGDYPALSPELSSGLRDLLPQLLNVDSHRRPAAGSLLAHPFLIHAALPRVHSDPSSHDSPSASLPASRRASMALSRLPSFYDDGNAVPSARNAAIASARTIASQLMEKQLSTSLARTKVGSRRPSVADMVPRPPVVGANSKRESRTSREITLAMLQETPRVSISRKSSLGDVANSVPPSPRLTNFPLREADASGVIRPPLSRLNSLRNLTKQKEIAKHAEKQALERRKKEEEERRLEEDKGHRRKEKQERAEKRRKDKERPGMSPAQSPGVSSVQFSMELPVHMSEEERLLWAIQVDEPHRDELANKYLDLFHRLLTDPNLSVHRLPRRRVTIRPPPPLGDNRQPSAVNSGATNYNTSHDNSKSSSVHGSGLAPQDNALRRSATTTAVGAVHMPAINVVSTPTWLNDYSLTQQVESKVVQRGPWPKDDDAGQPLTTAKNPIYENSRAASLLARLSATMPTRFAERVCLFIYNCCSTLHPHLSNADLFKQSALALSNLTDLRSQTEAQPSVLNTLLPQQIIALILNALSEGKSFLSPAAQNKLLSLVSAAQDKDNIEGVREALNMLPLPNRSVAYIVMSMLQSMERCAVPLSPCAERNKLTVSVLAAIFAPVIMRSPLLQLPASRVARPGAGAAQAVELLIRFNIDDLINKKSLMRMSVAMSQLLSHSSSDSSPNGSNIGSRLDDNSPPSSVKGWAVHAGKESTVGAPNSTTLGSRDSDKSSPGSGASSNDATSPRRNTKYPLLPQAIKSTGILVREGASIFKVFKTRFVVLTKAGELEIWKDFTEYTSGNPNNRLMSIELSTADLAPVESTLGAESHLWLFTITARTGKKSEPYDLACDTEPDRFSWMIEILKWRSFSTLVSSLDTADITPAQATYASIALAEVIASREDAKAQAQKWSGIPKLLQQLEFGTLNSVVSISEASLAAMLSLSSVDDLRPMLAPHMSLFVKGLTSGTDRVKDLSLQIIVNLTNDATCRSMFRQTGVVPSLVTTLASEKMSDYMRENAALSLSVAASDPTIQTQLRSSVLLFSSVFAATLEQDNLRLRSLIVDLMAHCSKNEELWRSLMQSGVYTALTKVAKTEGVELPPSNAPTMNGPSAPSAATAAPAVVGGSVVANTNAPSNSLAAPNPLSGATLEIRSSSNDGLGNIPADDRAKASAIVKALQLVLKDRASRSPREAEPQAPSVSEIRRPSGHLLPVRADEAVRFLVARLAKGEEREDEMATLAANEWLTTYVSTSFGHSQLYRLIILELPPRKGAFHESMVGVLRLTRFWVLNHFVRDFWKAKLEVLLRTVERRLPVLQYEVNRIKLAILRKQAVWNKAESSPRGSSVPLRRTPSKHVELASSKMKLVEDLKEKDLKNEKKEDKDNKEAKGSTLPTPGRTAALKNHPSQGVLSPRKKQ